jgi:hypothetical protein
MAIINNLHYAIRSESLQLQVKKCPIDGQQWAHENALLATIRQRLQQLVIVHSIQTHTWCRKRGCKTVMRSGTTNKISGNNKQSALCH